LLDFFDCINHQIIANIDFDDNLETLGICGGCYQIFYQTPEVERFIARQMY
jgi:hypothetical protein